MLISVSASILWYGYRHTPSAGPLLVVGGPRARWQQSAPLPASAAHTPCVLHACTRQWGMRAAAWRSRSSRLTFPRPALQESNTACLGRRPAGPAFPTHLARAHSFYSSRILLRCIQWPGPPDRHRPCNQKGGPGRPGRHSLLSCESAAQSLNRRLVWGRLGPGPRRLRLLSRSCAAAAAWRRQSWRAAASACAAAATPSWLWHWSRRPPWARTAAGGRQGAGEVGLARAGLPRCRAAALRCAGRRRRRQRLRGPWAHLPVVVVLARAAEARGAAAVRPRQVQAVGGGLAVDGQAGGRQLAAALLVRADPLDARCGGRRRGCV
jgi:hypothetical protein